MESVVYILGAGFSAPLGLPVMANFLEKAKDLYFKDPTKFSYFNEVFREINHLYKIAGFFKSDLFNIEEILSILEMKSSLAGKFDEGLFTKFISDVISAYTPEIKPPPDLITTPQNWPISVYRSQDGWSDYLRFTYGLFNLKVTPERDRYDRPSAFHFDSNLSHSRYSVITLNYDLVLEKAIERLLQCTRIYGNSQKPHFQREQSGDLILDKLAVPLAKLHGSTDSNDITPPTWNKSLDEKVKASWQLAYKVLSNANHIRILGYSLPTTDAYVRYLLKSAILENHHLKSLDVICKGASVKSNFDEFIQFHKYRYFNVDIKQYLDPYSVTRFGGDPVSNDGSLGFYFLEELHALFAKQNA